MTDRCPCGVYAIGHLPCLVFSLCVPDPDVLSDILLALLILSIAPLIF